MPTVCSKCKYVYRLHAKDGWWRWMCLQAKLQPGPNYVTGGVTDPYRLCRYVNDGDCEMYEEEKHQLVLQVGQDYLNDQPKGE